MTATSALFADTPDDYADYLINGLVKLIANGKPQEARVAVAKADEVLFENPIHRDLFRAMRLALEYSPAPGLPEIKFLAEHDDHGSAPADQVVERLCRAVKLAADIEWHQHVDSSIRQLRLAHGVRQARELGRELVNATSRPTPERCDDIIRAARQIQDGLTTSGRRDASTLLEMIDEWKQLKEEKILATGFDPIDRPLGGGLPVGLHGIAAGPRCGKSAVAVQIALGSLLYNPSARVLWMRGEMTNNLLLSRMLACWSQLRGEVLDIITLRDARKRSAETRAVYRDMAEIVGDRMVVVDPPVTPSSVERWIDESRPDLVVVDYLQKIEVGGFKDRRAELDHAVRRLSLASTRADVPMVVLSAVAGNTVRSIGGADIGTLTKESNQLDFEAHSFWTLWPQGDKEDSPRRVLLRNNKSRSDREVDSDLFFHGATQFFQLAAAPEYEEFGGFAPR